MGLLFSPENLELELLLNAETFLYFYMGYDSTTTNLRSNKCAHQKAILEIHPYSGLNLRSNSMAIFVFLILAVNTFLLSRKKHF